MVNVSPTLLVRNRQAPGSHIHRHAARFPIVRRLKPSRLNRQPKCVIARNRRGSQLDSAIKLMSQRTARDNIARSRRNGIPPLKNTIHDHWSQLGVRFENNRTGIVTDQSDRHFEWRIRHTMH